jgi:TatD DNase family protein
MLIDTHSHLNFRAFKDDYKEVVKRCQGQNIWLINAGTQYGTSKRAVEIAEENKEGVFAAIGLHPIHITKELVKIKNDDEETEVLGRGEEFNAEDYKKLAESKKVVAVGEIGLDYFYKPKTKARLQEFKEKQKQVFLQQLDLARDLDLPAIIHCRMAHDEMIKILGSQIAVSYKRLRGVIHCFTGTAEQMEQYLNLGFYIGFNGIIYKLDLKEAIEKCPLDKILVETDCPYLTPKAEGEKRNEPVFVRYIAEDIAKIRDMSYEEISKITTENARKLFNI